MAGKLTNLERLEAARVAVARYYTDAEKRIINRMTEQEVRFLMRMRKKYGATRKGRAEIRPGFPV